MSPNAPTYRKIAEDLRAQIQAGELPAGATLPTQQELAERYSVARMTARQAIGELINEGLVVSQQGKGATVRKVQRMIYRPQSEREPRTTKEMDRFMAEFSSVGRKPEQSIEVAVVPASEFIAKRLNVSVGDPVAVRKRIRFLDGEPFNINDTYYRYDLASDTAIMNPADLPRGSNYVLEEKGLSEVRVMDEFYVRMPVPDETHRLALRAGTPVAVHVATGYTASDEPMRCDVFILPGDRHVIVYERIHSVNQLDEAE